MSSRKGFTCLCQGLLATKKASNPYLQIQSENYERVTIGRLLTLTYDRYQSKGQKPHLGVSIEKRERETPCPNTKEFGNRIPGGDNQSEML